jgi:outer membrane protein OmpA-like peptidoglycan-associated protein
MMRPLKRIWAGAVLLGCLACGAPAAAAAAQAEPSGPPPRLVTKSVQAVGFEVGGGSTKVNLVGTTLMPEAKGEARVEIKPKAGATGIDVDLHGLRPPTTFGAEFLTYVLWAVTPEGRTLNTGEILLNKNGDGKLSATTPAQTFSLIVTAEPYFAVHIPSEVVVLQSRVRKGTKGRIFPVSEYTLMSRAQYAKLGNPLAMTPDLKHVPLEMYEARNAVEIAKLHGAPAYAPETFSKAESSLKLAEQLLASKASKNTIISTARQTVQSAEDARALAVDRQEKERIAKEREEAAAKARAEAETKAAAEAAAARQRAEAEAAAARQKAEEEASEAKRIADEQAAEAKAQADAEIARRQAALEQAERQKQELRQRLLQQFNRVLPTTDTPRGLVVNMGDVLFDTGKSDLRPAAREALAKLSGIVLNYPTLHLTIEGYTDSTGSAEFNQALSEKRAGSVMDYLVKQGLDEGSLTAKGFGMNNPIADNSTAAGRQLNRRVEIVVSGEVIGTQIGAKQSQ